MAEHAADPVAPRQPTIRDVARSAGVSVSTVSHVLSGKRPTGAATKQRVEAAVRDLGYRPNAVAQSLVWRRPLTLGLVIPDIANPYFPTLARGVEDRVRAEGYTLVLGNSAYDVERERSYLELLRAHQLGGVIYCVSDERSPVMADLHVAASEGLPVVLLHSPAEGITTVCADNRDGGRQVGEYLLGLGHTRFGVISGLPLDEGVTDRELGFLGALSARGLPVDRLSVPVAYGNHQIDGGRQAAREVLRVAPDVTAVFALNDLMALGALDVFRTSGRRVPEDISVVGFDDIPFAELANPPLTTVAQPIRDLGEQAADLLLGLLKGALPDPYPSVLVPSSLVVRESSGPAR